MKPAVIVSMRASLTLPLDIGALLASVKGSPASGKTDPKAPVDAAHTPPVEPFSTLMEELSQPDAEPQGKPALGKDILPSPAVVTPPPVSSTKAAKLSPEEAPKKPARKPASNAVNDLATVNVALVPPELKPPVGIPAPPMPVGNPAPNHENPKPAPQASPNHPLTEPIPHDHPQPLPAATPSVASDPAPVEAAKVAFEARLHPLVTEAPPTDPSAVEQPKALKPQAAAPEIRPAETSASERSQPVEAPAGKHNDNSRESPERQSKTSAAPAQRKPELTLADPPVDNQPKTNPMAPIAPAQPAALARPADPAPPKTTPAPTEATPEPDPAPAPPRGPQRYQNSPQRWWPARRIAHLRTRRRHSRHRANAR